MTYLSDIPNRPDANLNTPPNQALEGLIGEEIKWLEKHIRYIQRRVDMLKDRLNKPELEEAPKRFKTLKKEDLPF